jgi:hypothetical protein
VHEHVDAWHETALDALRGRAIEAGWPDPRESGWGWTVTLTLDDSADMIERNLTRLLVELDRNSPRLRSTDDAVERTLADLGD